MGAPEKAAVKPRMRALWPALVTLCLAGCGSSSDEPSGAVDPVEPANTDAAPVLDEQAWRVDVEQWREGRMERLTAEDGWLSLTALEFPGEGDWLVGNSERADLRMISGPEVWGRLRLSEGQAWFEAANESVQVDGQAVDQAVELLDAQASDSVQVSAGTGVFRVQRRPSGLAFRARDAQAPTRLAFEGVSHYPVDPAWRFEAEWQPHEPPRDIEIANVLGELSMSANPGRAVFEMEGQQVSLEALEGEDSLFFIFADRTSGRETFGLGRFLYTDLPVDGRVVLDFNRAYNPPCAFTGFTSCPLPPQSNRINARIEAGELRPPNDAF